MLKDTKNDGKDSNMADMITFQKTTKTLIDWSEQTKIPVDTIQLRLDRGWDVFRTLTTSVSERSNYTVVLCSWCGEPFAKLNKRVAQTNKLNKQHTCSRKCASALINEQRRCEPTTINAAHTRKDKEKFPEKAHSRYLVRQMIKSGKLIPLKECEFCGSDNRVEAHHPDHSRPFFLLYLCKDCHSCADNAVDKWENLATDYSEFVT